MKSDIKGLWAVGWRMLVLSPFVAVFGSLFFMALIVLTFFLPICALGCLIAGDYLYAAAAIIGWLLWLRFGRRVRKYADEGWAYAGL
jgi:hypothetical protein